MRNTRLLVYLAAVPAAVAAAAPTYMLHSPALSRTQIVFDYAGDLWSVGR